MIKPIYEKTETYTKSHRIIIFLVWFRLRCLKQHDLESITKWRLNIRERGFAEEAKDEMLKDNLMFRQESEQFRRYGIIL